MTVVWILVVFLVLWVSLFVISLSAVLLVYYLGLSIRELFETDTDLY